MADALELLPLLKLDPNREAICVDNNTWYTWDELMNSECDISILMNEWGGWRIRKDKVDDIMNAIIASGMYSDKDIKATREILTEHLRK